MAVTPLPIHTDRLTLRPMIAADAEALAAYRNDEDIARYQEWNLPFTPDDARRFVSEVSELPWPLLGHWNQLAVEHDGTMIGDVGVSRSEDGLQASIGYTLAPAHHGEGSPPRRWRLWSTRCSPRACTASRRLSIRRTCPRRPCSNESASASRVAT